MCKLITKSGELDLVFALMDMGLRTNQDEAAKTLNLLYPDGCARVDAPVILVAVYSHIEAKRKQRVLNEIFPDSGEFNERSIGRCFESDCFRGTAQIPLSTCTLAHEQHTIQSSVSPLRGKMMSEPQSEYSKSYSDPNFWEKVRTYAQSAGVEVIDRAFQLYYAAHGPNTPVWAKATIIGALGYFISPVDAIPDLVPVVGYSDDLGVLALATATVAAYITPEVKAQAKQAQKDMWDNVFGGS